jgi:hypothetical protein
MRRLPPAICLLLALLVLPPVATAAERHQPLESIEPIPSGHGPEPLKDACGVAVDFTGRTYVSNYYESAVYVFGPPGQEEKRGFETSIEIAESSPGATGKAAGGPCDLAFDKEGDLYVNRWHHDVIELPRLPQIPQSPPEFGPEVVIDPHDSTSVDVDQPSGHVFVDDRTYIAEYDASGAPVLEGGEPVRIGLGTLGSGYGVAVSGFEGAPGFKPTAGFVYVADAADETVKVYDSTKPAEAPKIIDGGGTPLLRFNHLADSDVAVDPVDGHVYVVDNLSPGLDEPEAVVHEFSSLGHYRGPVPSKVAAGHPSGVVDGEPSAVAVAAGKIYLTSGNYFDDNDLSHHGNSTVLTFGPAPAVETGLLNVTKTGAGIGTVFSSSPAGLGCGTACVGEFPLAMSIVLEAVPAAGSQFAGWTGCPNVLAGAPPRCSTAVSNGAETEVGAEFEPIGQHRLTVAKAGSGAGTVASVPARIDCGVVCGGDFDEGSTVILAATASQHSAFAGWSGCDSETAAGGCVVAMGADRSVTAGFDAVAEPPDDRPPPPLRPSIESLVSGILGPGPVGPLRIRGVAVHGDSARLRVAVPSAGSLSISGPGLRPVSALPFAAGNVTVLLRLSPAGRRSLARSARHRLRVKVGLAFEPLNGAAAVRADRSVAFRGTGARQRHPRGR